jgi:hypothetical protein
MHMLLLLLLLSCCCFSSSASTPSLLLLLLLLLLLFCYFSFAYTLAAFFSKPGKCRAACADTNMYSENEIAPFNI